MNLEPTEELNVHGVRLLHPTEAEVTTDEVETRTRSVRTIRVRAPWVTSESDPGLGAPYEIRIMVFEGAGPDILPGTDSPRYRMKAGRIAGREATLRVPVDTGEMRKAAFVRGESRFFFIEWRGPVEAVLETLELEG